MNKSYDCTADVQKHQVFVYLFLEDFASKLLQRAEQHDASKLLAPEKENLDRWKPVLDSLVFGSQEYRDALKSMDEGLRAHFRYNRHHPEHFPGGVNEMNLVDLVEMFCDWMAITTQKGTDINWEYLSERFSIEAQLLSILQNTATALVGKKQTE